MLSKEMQGRQRAQHNEDVNELHATHLGDEGDVGAHGTASGESGYEMRGRPRANLAWAAMMVQARSRVARRPEEHEHGGS